MSDNNPFKRKNSKEVYKNPWISVREDAVVRPDGSDGIFGVVSVKYGAKVVAVTEKNNLLLAREYKYGVNEITIECLGGGIDEGETPEEAAKRELLEEAGAESSKWTYLGYSMSLPTMVDFREHLFVAQNTKIVRETKTDGGEHIEVIEVPFDEAISKINSGEITQDTSIVAILRAHLLLNQ